MANTPFSTKSETEQKIQEAYQELDGKIDGVSSGYIGTIAIADTPTEDGIYTPTEDGTYTNAGGLVYDPDGVDKGFDVKFIKTGSAWDKSVVHAFNTETIDLIDELKDDVFSSENIVQVHSDVFTMKGISTDGNLVSAGSTGSNVKEYEVDSNKEYYADGYAPRVFGSTSNCMVAYFQDAVFLGWEFQLPETASGGEGKTNVKLTLPASTNKIWIYGNDTQQNKLSLYEKTLNFWNKDEIVPIDIENIKSIGNIKEEIFDESKTTVDFTSKKNNKVTTTEGVETDAITSGAHLSIYTVDEENKYSANGYSPSASSGNAMLSYYDSNDVFLGYERPLNSEGVSNFDLTLPAGTSKIKIFGNNTKNAGLFILIEDVSFFKKNNFFEQLTPQIKNNPLPKKNKTTDTLKVLCFGSSWGLCTYYYLGKMLDETGVNYDIKGVYAGGASFADWNQKYRDNSPVNVYPLETEDQTPYGRLFRDYLEVTDWDVIFFQQGARQSVTEEFWNSEWENEWSELVSNVKSSNNNAAIIFNSTFAPAYTNSVEMAPYPTTREGQKMWQQDNFTFAKRFMGLSGVDIAVPSGALLYGMRGDETINTEFDLAEDGLHPTNGLPMWGLSAGLFQTIIPQVFGIDIDSIEWMPDESTPRTPFSTDNYMPINATQRDRIKEIVKLAQSDRFGFRTL